MAFDQFELNLLRDALEQMREKDTQLRLSAFERLCHTPLNNEGWFEWELYYHLLSVTDRGWKREKHNRKGQNRQRGDGVDLQFINNRFIELHAVTTERTNMSWVLKGFIDHPDADAVLFLALNHENLKAWLRERTIGENRISH